MFFVLVVNPLLVLCVQIIFTTCLFTFLMMPSEDQKFSLSLAAQGLSCGTGDLKLWHMNS